LGGRGSAFGLQLLGTSNAPEDPDILQHAIFVYLHFLGPQVGHGVMVLVPDHHIQEHFSGRCMNYRAVWSNRGRGGLAKRYRESNQGMQGK
jgi:hypothetical protein